MHSNSLKPQILGRTRTWSNVLERTRTDMYVKRSFLCVHDCVHNPKAISHATRIVGIQTPIVSSSTQYNSVHLLLSRLFISISHVFLSVFNPQVQCSRIQTQTTCIPIRVYCSQLNVSIPVPKHLSSIPGIVSLQHPKTNPNIKPTQPKVYSRLFNLNPFVYCQPQKSSLLHNTS